MTDQPFRDYRIGDKVRVTRRDGTTFDTEVFGNPGHLVVLLPPEPGSPMRGGEHVPYERAELLEANPEIPLAHRHPFRERPTGGAA